MLTVATTADLLHRLRAMPDDDAVALLDSVIASGPGWSVPGFVPLTSHAERLKLLAGDRVVYRDPTGRAHLVTVRYCPFQWLGEHWRVTVSGLVDPVPLDAIVGKAGA